MVTNFKVYKYVQPLSVTFPPAGESGKDAVVGGRVWQRAGSGSCSSSPVCPGRNRAPKDDEVHGGSRSPSVPHRTGHMEADSKQVVKIPKAEVEKVTVSRQSGTSRSTETEWWP